MSKKSLYDYDIKNVFIYIFIFLTLFSFIQTSYQIFVPLINHITIIWKVIAIIYIITVSILNLKKIDYILLIVIFGNIYMLIPTYINNGYYVKWIGYFLDSVGLLIAIKFFSSNYKYCFGNILKFFCRFLIYLNFITLVLFPNGLFQEDNGYIITRYIFLGMDNQAVAILIPLFFILISLERKNNKKISLAFLLDVAIFVFSIILIWCANAIVALLLFLCLLLIQFIINKKLKIKHIIYISIFLFIFIVLLKGYTLFSSFIVDFLGKDITLSGRTTIWENGILEWLKKPIFGHGFQVSEAFINFEDRHGYVRGAHNQILNILLHGGIIYLIIFFIMLILLDKNTKKYSTNNSINLLILGVLVLMIMSMADTYGHFVGLYMLVGLLTYSKEIFVDRKELKSYE